MTTKTKTKTKPKLQFRPYGKLVKEPTAQLAMTHYHGWEIHREMYPETKNGQRGLGVPLTPNAPMTYTKYASKTTGLPEQYVRDLVRIGRCVPEDFLLSILGTELDNFMYLINIARLTEDLRNEK